MLLQWRLHLTLVGSAVLAMFNGPAICENPNMNWFLGGTETSESKPKKAEGEEVLNKQT